MKRIAVVLALCLATAALAGGIALHTSTRFEFTDCSSSGSSAQTVTRGSYLMRVTDSDVFVCYAATCASNGEKFPQGTVIKLSFGASQSVSCRSSGSAGDLILTDTGEAP